MIDLENKDILQINATVIAGALIFLTILTSVPNTEQEQISKSFSIIFSIAVITAFGFSSASVLDGDKKLASHLMLIGFCLIVVVAIILGVLHAVYYLESSPPSFNATNVNQSK